VFQPRLAVAIALLGLLAAPTFAARRDGDVTGTVTMPAPKKGKKPAYPGTGSSERLRGPAVVFIDGVKGDFKPPAEKVVMEQKGRQFQPLALAILKGTTVSFPNRDDEYHNAFSRSDARTFDLGRYATNESKDETFDKAGLVRIRCEIHSNMHAVIVVLENPHFAVTDDKGVFAIKGVPPGKYKVYAFHEDFEPKEKADDPLRAVVKEIEVTKDGVKVDFDLSGK
jgi:plastocyanin